MMTAIPVKAIFLKNFENKISKAEESSAYDFSSLNIFPITLSVKNAFGSISSFKSTELYVSEKFSNNSEHFLQVLR